MGRALGSGASHSSSAPSFSGLCGGGFGLRGLLNPSCWRTLVSGLRQLHEIVKTVLLREEGQGLVVQLPLLSQPGDVSETDTGGSPADSRMKPSSEHSERAQKVETRASAGPAVSSVLRKKGKVAGVSPGQPCTCCVPVNPRPMWACPRTRVVTGLRSVG